MTIKILNTVYHKIFFL